MTFMRMRTVALTLLVAISLVAAASGDARADDGEKPGAQLDRRLTLNFQGTPFEDCIQFFADITGVGFAFATDDFKDRQVSARMRDVKARDAILFICKAMGIEVEFEKADKGEVMIFRLQKKTATTGTSSGGAGGGGGR